jgi:hypothetical protein
LTEFRPEHRNLTDDELDRLIKRTFRIDPATLREMDDTYFYHETITPITKTHRCENRIMETFNEIRGTSETEDLNESQLLRMGGYITLCYCLQ